MAVSISVSLQTKVELFRQGIISLLSKNRGTGNILKDSLKISYIRLIHSLSRNTICLVTIFSTPFLLSDKFFRQKNMLGRFFKSYSSSQSEKRLTINFRFSSAVCRARLRFLKCFIFTILKRNTANNFCNAL